MTEKLCFGAIPFRAFGDERLHAAHFRLLGVIATHDRFNANGQGCRAGNARLAELTGSNYSALSRTLKQLADWGYIEGYVNPLNKRLRVYVVLYTVEDFATFKSEDNASLGQISPNEVVTEDGEIVCTGANNADSTVCTHANDPPPIVCTEANQPANNHLNSLNEPNPNILRETYKIFGETSEKYSVETGGLEERNSGGSDSQATLSAEGKLKPVVHSSAKTVGSNNVIPLTPSENNQAEQQALNRLVEMLGPKGWEIVTDAPEARVHHAVEKTMTGLIGDEDLVLLEDEARSHRKAVPC